MIFKGITEDKYVLEKKPLAEGGEGVIYDVTNANNKVAKIYHVDKLSQDLEEKLIIMVNNPPGRAVLNQVAWPLDILHDSKNRFCGYIMPKLDITDILSDVYKYTPKDHNQISVSNKIIIATNICAVIDAVHKAGYVFGDFNPKNIGVNANTGRVAFLDTDTYHIFDPTSGKTYKCKVGFPGYVAPELIRACEKNKTTIEDTPLPTFTQETDNFALAIHIFRLLMNGYSPYNGIKETESVYTANPGIGNAAIRLNSYCFRPGYKPKPDPILPLETLPKTLANLFSRAFIDGKNDPKRRPSATDWNQALLEFEKNLKTCDKNKSHQYKIGLTECPYCEADARFADALLPGSQKQSTLSQRQYKRAKPAYPTGTQSRPSRKPSTPASYPPPKPSSSAPVSKNNQEGQKKANTSLYLAIGSIFIPYLGFILSTAAIAVSKKAKGLLNTYDIGYGKAKAAGVIGWLVTSTYLIALCFIVGLGGSIPNFFGNNQLFRNNLLSSGTNASAREAITTELQDSIETPIKEDESPLLANSEENVSIEDSLAIPINYRCADINDVNLFIEAKGEVGKLSLNLREQPKVPEDPRQNVVGYLLPGDIVIVVDGPRCAEGGTWWKVEVEGSRKTGWVREYHNVYGHLLLLVE